MSAARERLSELLAMIGSGGIRVVDLTHVLSAEFPALQLPPEFGQAWAFKQERISRYDTPGPGWYWNNLVQRAYRHAPRCAGALDQRQGSS